MNPSDQEQAPGGRRIYTPSRLNREVRLLLEAGFPSAWVAGEISNLFRARSGHVYFTLKDEGAQLKCALFRQRDPYGRMAPREGQQVLLRGRLSVYEPRGEFQLIVDYLEDAGEGRLRQAFEALKAKLAAEGLFSEARKRALPRFPRRIAVVTSPDGAAIRDVLSVLGRRYPVAHVLLVPSRVQGPEAPAELCQALRRAVSLAPDVVLLTRGGGSLEDLWAFNDETLARELAALPVPTVCAVGHESDFSIAELVADRRGATPSAAAELLVPDRADLRRTLARLSEALARGTRARIRTQAQRLAQWRGRLGPLDPRRAAERRLQRVDEFQARLDRAVRRRLRDSAQTVAQTSGRLRALHPTRRLEIAAGRAGAAARQLGREARRGQALRREALAGHRRRLARAMAQALESRGARLTALRGALRALSPQAVLDRGFSVTTVEDTGALVRSAAAVAEGERLVIRLAEGGLRARVEDRRVEAGGPAAPAD